MGSPIWAPPPCCLMAVMAKTWGLTVNEFWVETWLTALPGQSPEAVTWVRRATVAPLQTSATWPVTVNV